MVPFLLPRPSVYCKNKCAFVGSLSSARCDSDASRQSSVLWYTAQRVRLPDASFIARQLPMSVASIVPFALWESHALLPTAQSRLIRPQGCDGGGTKGSPLVGVLL